MTGFEDHDLSSDAFLSGRLSLLQPRKGYRAGIDPILLAAAVPAKPGQSVLDLGCGAGAAILALAARVPELTVTGVEVQPGYAQLAQRNAERNAIALDVVQSDLVALPDDLKQRQFDHVIANPPYFDPNRRSAATDRGRETALAEQTPLETWIDVAARRLAPKGMLHMIHRIERLPDVLAACGSRVGALEILPLCARQGKAAHLMLLRARKGGRADFRLHAPLILHEGTRHDGDRDSYQPAISAVLRDGELLRWP